MASRAYKDGYDRIDWSDMPRRKRRVRPIGVSGGFPVPHIVRPFSEPVKSMADGKFYDDPASLRATYKASGNPQGVDYIEVGNEDTTRFTPPKEDRKAKRDAIARAIADVENGRIPPVLENLPG